MPFKRLTTPEFIDKAKAAHPNRDYDYSRAEYVDSHTKVIIGCDRGHGWFEQRPYAHTNSKQGCPICGKESKVQFRTMGQAEFIKRARLIHADKDYDYSRVVYVCKECKVVIGCKEHGWFEQRPGHHLNSKAGCPKCGLESISKKLRLSLEEFIRLAKSVHGDRYDYSRAIYKGIFQKVVIVCPLHGNFEQSPQSHLRGGKCPECNYSLGELVVSETLNLLGIKYETQKKFGDCRNPKTNRRLPFDFYFTLNDVSFLIEYQGIQHYKTVRSNYFGDSIQLQDRKALDRIKATFARAKGIHLIVIPYTVKDIKTFIDLHIKKLTQHQPRLISG